MVTVDDLIQGNEASKKLLKLDINFLLNAVLNKIIDLPLDDTRLEALFDIKDTRMSVVHASYHFGQEDFNKHLSTFEKAAKVLYEHLGLAMGELQHHVADCRKNVNKGCKVLCILGKCLLKDITEIITSGFKYLS